jgi:hypothetical protein
MLGADVETDNELVQMHSSAHADTLCQREQMGAVVLWSQGDHRRLGRFARRKRNHTFARIRNLTTMPRSIYKTRQDDWLDRWAWV